MAYKGQILSDEQKNKHKEKYANWRTTPKGIEHFEKEKIKMENRRIEYYLNPKLCKQCKKIIPFEKTENDFCCRSCGANYSNAHRAPMTEEQKIKISNTMKEKVLNGTYIHTNPKNSITKTCIFCKNTFLTTLCYKNSKPYCSKKCYLLDPNKKIGLGVGGYRKGSGRGKKGWYKGYWCDSSYELAFVIFNLEHNIFFKRNTERFDYLWENKIHYWIPDFIMEDGSYLEIKGFMTEQNKAKISQFSKPLKVLMKPDIQYAINYSIAKYGKKYIELYE